MRTADSLVGLVSGATVNAPTASTCCVRIVESTPFESIVTQDTESLPLVDKLT